MNFSEVSKAHKAYQRKAAKLRTIGIVIFVLLMIPAVLSGVFVAVVFSGVFLAILVIGIMSAVGAFYGRKERVVWREMYKAYFVEKNLQKYFKIKYYNHAAGFTPAVLGATGMINTGDRFNSNDYIEGFYGEVAFKQADVHIETEHTDSEGHTSYVTIFRGRWMVFEFPKKFNFRMEVVEKGFQAHRVPGKDAKTGRKFEKLKVESPEFNKLFKVWAEDGFEAFYLLDPSLIENITHLGEAYKGRMILCFVGNQLHVGLHDGKDAFEPPSVFKSLDENAENKKIQEDIKLIVHFIDQLKLSRKIFR